MIYFESILFQVACYVSFEQAKEGIWPSPLIRQQALLTQPNGTKHEQHLHLI
jgi:hypothetical protein